MSHKSELWYVVVLSATKVEYITLTEAIKEAVWIKSLLRELGFIRRSTAI